MVKLENGELKGNIEVRRQFLHGSKDVNDYTVIVKFDGVSIQTLVEHAMNDYIIQLRKSVKTKEQAESLAKGITFGAKFGAAPKDPNIVAATLDVNQLSDDTLNELIRKLQTRKAKNTETGEDIE